MSAEKSKEEIVSNKTRDFENRIRNDVEAAIKHAREDIGFDNLDVTAPLAYDKYLAVIVAHLFAWGDSGSLRVSALGGNVEGVNAMIELLLMQKAIEDRTNIFTKGDVK